MLSKSTWSDNSRQKKYFRHNFRSGPKFSILTFCQFPDLPIVFWKSQSHKSLAFDAFLMKKHRNLIIFYLLDLVLCFRFWKPSFITLLMTLWVMSHDYQSDFIKSDFIIGFSVVDLVGNKVWFMDFLLACCFFQTIIL